MVGKRPRSAAAPPGPRRAASVTRKSEAPAPFSERHARNRFEERDRRAVQGRRRPADAHDVRIVLLVRREDKRYDLRFVIVPFGKKRAQRPVDQPGSQYFLFCRPPFALEESARNLARGIGILTVVHSERKEVHPFPWFFRGASRRQYHSVPIANISSAVRLPRHPSHFDGKLPSADFGSNSIAH